VKRSAGILLYRRRPGGAEVLLVHPGGPLWSRKDLGAWSIPKGEHGPAEEPLTAALRELEEETGIRPGGTPLPLGAVRQAGGKEVRAWGVEGDADAGAIRSNTFALEWPPRSGRTAEFPEVDRAGWFPLDLARRKILKGQLPLLEELERLLRAGSTPPRT
jgi:predicted NUDIX family NTP pyrophosphohydrolase